MLEKIKKLATAYGDEVVAFRREFHMHPERSWEEVETSKKVVEALKGLGCTIVKTGFGGTESGVVAEMKGGKPGKCVALRADIEQIRHVRPTAVNLAWALARMGERSSAHSASTMDVNKMDFFFISASRRMKQVLR
mgnify:CR=1 FL=1